MALSFADVCLCFTLLDRGSPPGHHFHFQLGEGLSRGIKMVWWGLPSPARWGTCVLNPLRSLWAQLPALSLEGLEDTAAELTAHEWSGPFVNTHLRMATTIGILVILIPVLLGFTLALFTASGWLLWILASMFIFLCRLVYVLWMILHVIADLLMLSCMKTSNSLCRISTRYALVLPLCLPSSGKGHPPLVFALVASVLTLKLSA